MRKNIVAAVAGILTAGVTYLNAQTNTNTTGGPFWVQNVSFTLQAQTTSGKRVISTKDIIADMSGITVTNAGGGTNGTTITNSVTVTNHPIFALAGEARMAGTAPGHDESSGESARGHDKSSGAWAFANHDPPPVEPGEGHDFKSAIAWWRWRRCPEPDSRTAPCPGCTRRASIPSRRQAQARSGRGRPQNRDRGLKATHD